MKIFKYIDLNLALSYPQFKLNNQNIRPNMPLMVKECVASLKTQLILSNVPSDVDVNRLRKDLSCHFSKTMK